MTRPLTKDQQDGVAHILNQKFKPGLICSSRFFATKFHLGPEEIEQRIHEQAIESAAAGKSPFHHGFEKNLNSVAFSPRLAAQKAATSLAGEKFHGHSYKEESHEDPRTLEHDDSWEVVLSDVIDQSLTHEELDHSLHMLAYYLHRQWWRTQHKHVHPKDDARQLSLDGLEAITGYLGLQDERRRHVLHHASKNGGMSAEGHLLVTSNMRSSFARIAKRLVANVEKVGRFTPSTFCATPPQAFCAAEGRWMRRH
jgi:hypothetical protein